MSKYDYKFYDGKFDKIRIKGDNSQARKIIIEKMGLTPDEIKPVYSLATSHGTAKEFKIEGGRIRKKIDRYQ